METQSIGDAEVSDAVYSTADVDALLDYPCQHPGHVQDGASTNAGAPTPPRRSEPQPYCDDAPNTVDGISEDVSITPYRAQLSSLSEAPNAVASATAAKAIDSALMGESAMPAPVAALFKSSVFQRLGQEVYEDLGHGDLDDEDSQPLSDAQPAAPDAAELSAAKAAANGSVAATTGTAPAAGVEHAAAAPSFAASPSQGQQPQDTAQESQQGAAPQQSAPPHPQPERQERSRDERAWVERGAAQVWPRHQTRNRHSSHVLTRFMV